jgi:hypothetical protein
MTGQLWALVVFSGDFDPDPAGAAAALRQSGYVVFELPEQSSATVPPQG